MPKENEFYLLDTRTYLGSTCTFWAIDGHGYVSNLKKAHIFNFEEAQKWSKWSKDRKFRDRVKVPVFNGNSIDLNSDLVTIYENPKKDDRI